MGTSIEAISTSNGTKYLNHGELTDEAVLFSECVRSTKWDFESEGIGDLTISFTDGTQYVYHNVSPLVFYNLLRANSPGGFFNRYIRDKYAYERV